MNDPLRVMLLGATGAVGREVLRQALAHSGVDEVVAVTRRSLPPADRLVNVVADLAGLDEHAPWWAVDAVVCTLGTTLRAAGSREAFAAIDRDLVVRSASCARRAGATRFALTSSVGATLSGSFYLRTKAEAEEGVRRLGYPSLTVVRPSLLDAERAESRPGERLAIVVARALRPLIPRHFRAVSPSAVAGALLEGVVRGAPGVTMVESEELEALSP